MDRVFSADRVLTSRAEWGPGRIEIAGDRIAAVGPATGEEPEHIAGVVVPGFVDIHVHGAVGIDFGSATGDSEVLAAAEHHFSRGTTTLVASVASSGADSMERSVRLLARGAERGILAGIHLEGPYLSARRRGAHRADRLRAPDIAELERLLDAGAGAIRMVTLAPEIPGAFDLIRLLVARGVVPAIGHSDCDAETARAAVDAGARVFTHLFNGMPPFHHREVGPVGVALTDPRVVAELILDRFHLASEAQRVAVGALHGRVAVVSDAMQATGCEDGDYRIADSDVRVVDGAAWLADGSSLAGSTSTVADGFARLRTELGHTLAEAIEATSATPSRALGLEAPALAAGDFADLVVLDADAARVVRTMRRGRWLTS